MTITKPKPTRPPRKPGEGMRQYIKRLVELDPLTIQDRAEMRAKWALHHHPDSAPTTPGTEGGL